MHPVSRVVLAAVATLAVTLPPAPAGAVRAADPALPVTPASTLTVTGNGYGHGHGMSQYGARNAAARGVSHAAILGFYYPGTQLATYRATIRVLLTRDTDNDTVVLPRRGLRVKDTATGRSWWLPTNLGAKAWRLSVVDGRTRVSYRTDRWRAFRPGGRATLSGDGQFSSKYGPVTLRTPSGDRAYRGALRLSHRDTVNVLGLQRYLKGVVPAEVPAGWPANALQAQAVAARTYAARARTDDASRYFHICDTTSCQVYNGHGAEQASTNAAVNATVGQVLTYGGKPAFTQFSSSSGGWTSAGGQPYLVAKQDQWTALDDPHHGWTKELAMSVLQTRYGGTLGKLQGVRIATREGGGEWGGWVQTVVLDGTAEDVTISGATFRSLYKLKSAYFTLAP